jgi:hypothetical protein
MKREKVDPAEAVVAAGGGVEVSSLEQATDSLSKLPTNKPDISAKLGLKEVKGGVKPIAAKKTKKKPLPDCPLCEGTGEIRVNVYGPCGLKENSEPLAGDCACLTMNRRGNPALYDDLKRVRDEMVRTEEENHSESQIIRQLFRPTIKFDVAVREGKQIVARIDGDQLRLGELAERLEPIYGERTLQRFAQQIGVAACTLKRRRSVFRAWIGAPAPQSYSVAQELAAHPDRAEIVRANPNITKLEARDKMKELRIGSAHTDASCCDRQRSGRNQNSAKWFRDAVKLANEAIRTARIADGEIEPDLERPLQAAIDPALLPTLRASGEALIRLADRLQQIVGEPAALAEAAE